MLVIPISYLGPSFPLTARPGLTLSALVRPFIGDEIITVLSGCEDKIMGRGGRKLDIENRNVHV